MSTGIDADGRLEVFARGSDHRIYHNWQINPGAGPWNGFTPLGSPDLDIFASGPSVNAAGVRRLHVFVRGLQNDLWHIFQKQLNGSWSDWESFGGKLAGTPVPATQEDGRVVVFSTGSNGDLLRLEQQTVGGTDFEWAPPLAPPSGSELVGSPAACSNADGSLVVLAAFNDNVLRFCAQTAPNGSLGSWNRVTGPVSGTPAAILNGGGSLLNADLRMQIIFPGAGDDLVGVEQTTSGDPVEFSLEQSGVTQRDRRRCTRHQPQRRRSARSIPYRPNQGTL